MSLFPTDKAMGFESIFWEGKGQSTNFPLGWMIPKSCKIKGQ